MLEWNREEKSRKQTWLVGLYAETRPANKETSIDGSLANIRVRQRAMESGHRQNSDVLEVDVRSITNFFLNGRKYGTSGTPAFIQSAWDRTPSTREDMVRFLRKHDIHDESHMEPKRKQFRQQTVVPNSVEGPREVQRDWSANGADRVWDDSRYIAPRIKRPDFILVVNFQAQTFKEQTQTAGDNGFKNLRRSKCPRWENSGWGQQGPHVP